MKIQIITAPEGVTWDQAWKWYNTLKEEEANKLRPQVREALKEVDMYTGIEYTMLAYLIYHNLPLQREIIDSDLRVQGNITSPRLSPPPQITK